MEILKIKDLTFSYSKNESNNKPVLDNINLSINKGDFVIVCGESGCGKTTLLRLMKKELMPKGEKSGSIYFQNTLIEELDDRSAASKIGFVMQNPDNQIVTDKVWHELSFGLESLGEKNENIRKKVSEIAEYFGLTDIYHSKTSNLSGGQKQLINLASIIVMNPQLLILDEPTSQLDPIAAREFISSIKRINEEFGITIVLVEHRLEEVYHLATKVAIMEEGKIIVYDTPINAANKLKEIDVNHKMWLGLPTSIRLFNSLNIDDKCPLTVNEGKIFLDKHFKDAKNKTYDYSKNMYNENLQTKKIAIEIDEGFFRYERDSQDILNNLNLKIYENEFLCILGGNGAGKTTTLKVLSGVKRLYRGKYRLWNKKIKEYNQNTLYRNNISLLPQDIQTMFVKDNVLEDLKELCSHFDYSKEEQDKRINQIVDLLSINSLLNKHPYDLSGGEMQKVGLAKILLSDPKILLLDEVTKGIDAYSKKVLGDILLDLIDKGKTIVLVTHDVEFAAKYATRCALFFDGKIVSLSDPVEFFSNNNFYTTSASRISRDTFNNTIIAETLIKQCLLNGEVSEK